MKVCAKSHNSQPPFGIAAASLVIVLTLVLIGSKAGEHLGQPAGS